MGFIEHNLEDYDPRYKFFGFQCHSNTCPLEVSKKQKRMRDFLAGSFPQAQAGFSDVTLVFRKAFF